MKPRCKKKKIVSVKLSLEEREEDSDTFIKKESSSTGPV